LGISHREGRRVSDPEEFRHMELALGFMLTTKNGAEVYDEAKDSLNRIRAERDSLTARVSELEEALNRCQQILLGVVGRLPNAADEGTWEYEAQQAALDLNERISVLSSRETTE
jgi:hypothetical protein